MWLIYFIHTSTSIKQHFKVTFKKLILKADSLHFYSTQICISHFFFYSDYSFQLKRIKYWNLASQKINLHRTYEGRLNMEICYFSHTIFHRYVLIRSYKQPASNPFNFLCIPSFVLVLVMTCWWVLGSAVFLLMYRAQQKLVLILWGKSGSL